jgi:hypothetical protein
MNASYSVNHKGGVVCFVACCYNFVTPNFSRGRHHPPLTVLLSQRFPREMKRYKPHTVEDEFTSGQASCVGETLPKARETAESDRAWRTRSKDDSPLAFRPNSIPSSACSAPGKVREPVSLASPYWATGNNYDNPRSAPTFVSGLGANGEVHDPYQGYKAAGVLILSQSPVYEENAAKNSSTLHSSHLASPIIDFLQEHGLCLLLGLEQRGTRSATPSTHASGAHHYYWLHFQGRREEADAADPATTALRELEEETAGALSQSMRRQIANQVRSPHRPKFWDAISNYIMYVVILPSTVLSESRALSDRFQQRLRALASAVTACKTSNGAKIQEPVWQVRMDWIHPNLLIQEAGNDNTCHVTDPHPSHGTAHVPKTYPMYPYFWRCLRSRQMIKVIRACLRYKSYETLHTQTRPVSSLVPPRPSAQPHHQPKRKRASQASIQLTRTGYIEDGPAWVIYGDE